MLKRPKFNLSTIISILVILVLILPQTRKPLQIQVQKLIALISPSIEFKAERQKIENLNWKLKSLDNDIINLEETRQKIKII